MQNFQRLNNKSTKQMEDEVLTLLLKLIIICSWWRPILKVCSMVTTLVFLTYSLWHCWLLFSAQSSEASCFQSCTELAYYLYVTSCSRSVFYSCYSVLFLYATNALINCDDYYSLKITALNRGWGTLWSASYFLKEFAYQVVHLGPKMDWSYRA